MYRVIGLASGIDAKAAVGLTENTAAKFRWGSSPQAIEAMHSVLTLAVYPIARHAKGARGYFRAEAPVLDSCVTRGGTGYAGAYIAGPD